MKTKLLIVAVVVAVVVTATLVIAAGPRAVRPGPGPGMMAQQGPGQGFGPCFWLGPRIAKELGLDQGQIAQLKQIKEDFLTQTQATRELLKARMKDLAPLLTAETLDPAAIRTAFADIEFLKPDLHIAAVEKIILGLGVLTAEQRAKLGELIKNRPGLGLGMGCGMGFGPGCGGPGPGMGGGRGRGPGAGRGCCPFGGGGNPNCPLNK